MYTAEKEQDTNAKKKLLLRETTDAVHSPFYNNH